MLEQEKLDLQNYRIMTAKEKLIIAEELLNKGYLKDSINRSYYAFFHAMRAVIIHKGVDFSKHSAIIAYFQKEFIKTGIFDKRFSKIITEIFIFRSNADYEDFYIVERSKVEEQLKNAKEFVAEVEKYLQN